MAGKKTRKTTVSKGQRSNVSPKIVRAMREDRVELDNVDGMMQSARDRELNAKKSPTLAKRYAEEARVTREATALFEQYRGRVEWSQCVQAVKLNRVASLHSRHSKKLG